jgi:hypothetical protein
MEQRSNLQQWSTKLTCYARQTNMGEGFVWEFSVGVEKEGIELMYMEIRPWQLIGLYGALRALYTLTSFMQGKKIFENLYIYIYMNGKIF